MELTTFNKKELPTDLNDIKALIHERQKVVNENNSKISALKSENAGHIAEIETLQAQLLREIYMPHPNERDIVVEDDGNDRVLRVKMKPRETEKPKPKDNSLKEGEVPRSVTPSVEKTIDKEAQQE